MVNVELFDDDNVKYNNKKYCYERIHIIREIFGNKNTTKGEWENAQAELGVMLINCPKDIYGLVYSTLHEMTVRETYFRLKFWPEQKSEKVTYSQWPKGTHWYARIGNDDVCDDDGNYKWNTKAEAKEAVKLQMSRIVE